MKESHTIPNIEQVVIQQLPLGSILDYIQILGRTLRENKSTLHLIIVKDTIDEDVYNRLKELKLIN